MKVNLKTLQGMADIGFHVDGVKVRDIVAELAALRIVESAARGMSMAGLASEELNESLDKYDEVIK
jgi:hypothetical protein